MSNYNAWPHGIKGLFDTSFSDLTKTDTVRSKCYSYVIDQFMQMLKEYSEHIVLFREIEHLPDKLLDYLAIEWDLPYYEDDLDRETKIQLVKEGFNWRRLGGTVKGVEDLARKVFGNSIVSEWYEYGGDPGYFKIKTNTPFSEEKQEMLERLIAKEKNVRSWLDNIEFARNTDLYMNFGVNAHTRYIKNPPVQMIAGI